MEVLKLCVSLLGTPTVCLCLCVRAQTPENEYCICMCGGFPLMEKHPHSWRTEYLRSLCQPYGMHIYYVILSKETNNTETQSVPARHLLMS